MLNDLTTRELSILAWTLAGGGWALTHASVRSSLGDVFRSFFSRPILSFFLFLAVWTAAAVLVLETIGVWTAAQLKDTLIWFVLGASVMGMDAATGYDDPDYTKAVRNGLTIVVVVEFIVSAMTFPLLVELILVPVLALVGLLQGYARANEVDGRVSTFLDGVMVTLGALILTGAGYQAWNDYSALASLDGLRTLVLPPLLSLLLIPAMFALVIQARYEWLFLKLQGPSRFQLLARLRLVLLLGLSPSRILHFGRRHAFELPSVGSYSELSQLIQRTSEHAGEESPEESS